MSTDTKPSSGSTIVRVVIGFALMFGGMWFTKNVHLGFIDALNEQGIPLDLGKTIAAIGVFLIVFPLIRMFYTGPLQTAIDERNSELEKAFSEAESLRSEMGTMKSEYEARLQATEAQAREQIQSQIREAQNLRTQLMAEASAKADELVKRAQEEIASERDKAIAEVRIKVVDLTLQATERILGENLDDARNRKLVEEFIEKVEVPR